MSSGLSHLFFELLRIYFPYYENKADLVMERGQESGKVYFKLTFPSRTFIKEVGLWDQETALRKDLARWIIEEVDDPNKVESSWGMLTGIRPVKFVQKLRTSYSDEKVRDKLSSEYFIDKALVDLLMEISILESKLTCGLNPRNYSLYINIPFCPSRCHYCSYPTIKSSNREAIKLYMEGLLQELEFTLDYIGKKPDTIYVGGGTPTSIPYEDLERLLKILEKSSQGNEFTLEAGRPDTLDWEILNLLAQYRVNRISINPQTMNNKTLKDLGRQHSVEEIRDTYAMARKISSWDINMDLILGLPGESREDFKQTLEEIFRLDPENITVHTLSLKNGSKFYEKGIVDFKSVKDLESISSSMIQAANYRPYYMYRQKRILGNGMNIGYSKPGHESLYNMLMMEELQSVIGIGMSSTSKILDPSTDSCNKYSNFRNLRDYNQRFDEIVKKKQETLKELR